MDYQSATALLITCYAALILFFVIRGARSTKSMADYAVGSRHFSPVFVALSLAASITSAATFIINPGFVALYGWSAFLAMSIILPVGLYISLVVLSKSFRRYGATVKALTLSQWMGKRYESPAFALWFAFLGLLLITFVVLITVGITKVLAPALGLGELPVLIGTVVFVFGYMMFGGANSMVYTNAIQAGLMIIVAIVLMGSGWSHFEQGIGAFWDKVAAIDPYLVTPVNPASPLFRDWFEVLFCNFIIGVAIVCQPHIITRSLLLREERDVNRYLLVAIVVETLFFMVLFVGFYARLQFPDLQQNGAPMKMDGLVSAYVLSKFPVYAGLLVILGLLSAGLSTLEGLIQSLSTTITSDLIRPLSGNFLTDEHKGPGRTIALNRIVIALLAVVTIAWSYQQILYPKLSVGILAQNGVYAYFSAAFVPVLLGIFGKQVPKAAPIAASITAIVVHFSIYYGGLTPYTTGVVRNPAVSAALAILAALAVGLGVMWIRRGSTRLTAQ